MDIISMIDINYFHLILCFGLLFGVVLELFGLIYSRYAIELNKYEAKTILKKTKKNTAIPELSFSAKKWQKEFYVFGVIYGFALLLSVFTFNWYILIFPWSIQILFGLTQTNLYKFRSHCILDIAFILLLMVNFLSWKVTFSQFINFFI